MSNRTLMRFTGVGGQGVLLAGEIFAAAKIAPARSTPCPPTPVNLINVLFAAMCTPYN